MLLLGTDALGRVFAEETRTVTLSLHGAGIVSKHKLAADERLTLRVLGTSAGTEAAVRLVGRMGEDARGFIYGVAFADPNLDFWQIEFPSASKRLDHGESALQCSLCRTLEVVQQNEAEADVYALSGRILRFCQTCGGATVWRAPRPDGGSPTRPAAAGPKSAKPGQRSPFVRPDAGSTRAKTVNGAVVASPSVSGPTRAPGLQAPRPKVASGTSVAVNLPNTPAPQPLNAAASAVVARSSNRRRDVRIRVSFTACVRQEGASEEVVECDNISKRGISFRSRRSYATGSMVEVAAPYSPGSPAIFVPACIRHIEKLSGGTLFRYGAAYVPRSIGPQF